MIRALIVGRRSGPCRFSINSHRGSGQLRCTGRGKRVDWSINEATHTATERDLREMSNACAWDGRFSFVTHILYGVTPVKWRETRFGRRYSPYPRALLPQLFLDRRSECLATTPLPAYGSTFSSYRPNQQITSIGDPAGQVSLPTYLPSITSAEPGTRDPR